MSTLQADPDVMSTALSRLENLQPDEYIVAFGSGGKQFIGSPNGYPAYVLLVHVPLTPTNILLSAYLTEKAVEIFVNDNMKKVLWASFGDTPESWFFSFELKNGLVSVRLGDGAPYALHDYIDNISTSNHLLGSLRVQLGNNASYVLWSRTLWACHNIPEDLCAQLCGLSSNSRVSKGVTKGSLKEQSVTNVQWHEDGSFYIRTSDTHAWNFCANILHGAWRKMWGDSMGPKDPTELAVSDPQ
jgi:methylenetetrahydrofolate dehydrogenase (NADP+)/methenyltetrahydrofolate cyclohydrolase/formyltetrahydrofolate synthetase